MALLKAITFICTLICIITGSVLISLSSEFVIFEYSRDSFPQDRFGISQQERVSYALDSLSYLKDWHTDKKALPILTSLKFDQTQKQVFTLNEISHLVDVKHQITLMRMFFILAFTTLVSTFLHCFHHHHHLPIILKSMRNAVVIIIGLISLIALVIGFLWNSFFVIFHQLFFPQGNWTFPQTSSLMRLFPEIFWVDYAIFLITIMLLLSLITVLMTTYLLHFRSVEDNDA